MRQICIFLTNALILLNSNTAAYTLDPLEVQLCDHFQLPDNEYFENYLNINTLPKPPKSHVDTKFEIQFAARGLHSVFVVLATEPSTFKDIENGVAGPAYEIEISDDLSNSTLLTDGIDGKELFKVSTPGILSNSEYRVFTLKVNKDGRIKFGEASKEPVIDYKAETGEMYPIKYYSFTSIDNEARVLLDCPSFPSKNHRKKDKKPIVGSVVCKSNDKIRTTIKSKAKGTLCKTCGCEDVYGWVCTSRPGKCHDGTIDPYLLCKVGGAVWTKELSSDSDMSCRVCECNVTEGWKCMESRQPCNKHYNEEHSKKAEICKSNEVLVNCKSHCQPTCNNPKPACPPICQTGCVCKKGLVRNNEENCISKEMCTFGEFALEARRAVAPEVEQDEPIFPSRKGDPIFVGDDGHETKLRIFEPNLEGLPIFVNDNTQ